jgi:class 3 adenylate cyclase
MVEERAQRRLAAILAADVAGYSRLMGENEEATLATLNSYLSVIDKLILTHDGRVFGGAGDSVIAEFASPVEAVRCATEIQLETSAMSLSRATISWAMASTSPRGSKRWRRPAASVCPTR